MSDNAIERAEAELDRLTDILPLIDIVNLPDCRGDVWRQLTRFIDERGAAAEAALVAAGVDREIAHNAASASWFSTPQEAQREIDAARAALRERLV